MKNKWLGTCIYYLIVMVAITGLLVWIASKDVKNPAEKKTVSSEKTVADSFSYQTQNTSKKNTKDATCVGTGCTNKPMSGSIFCEKHDSKTKEKNTVKKSNSVSSSSKKTKKIYNPYDSYDAGYEDVYENDDYDWDRYWSDDDYADGVDDAMDELDW